MKPLFEIMVRWFENLSDLFLALEPEERILLLFALIIILFTILSAGFALYAFLVHLNRRSLEIRWKKLSDIWTGLLFDVLSGDRLVPELLETVPKGEELRFLNFLALYSRKLRGFELEQLRALADPYLDQLIPRLKEREPERRARAYKTAGELGFHRFADRIREGLEDDVPLVRMIAARALVTNGDQQDLVKIVANIDGFSSWSGRYVSSLLAQRGEEIVDELQRVLLDKERSTFSRSTCARALYDIHDSEAGYLAQQVLQEPVVTDLHVAALELVRDLGESSAAAQVRALSNVDNVIVRAHALSALGVVGDESDVPLLVESVGHSSPWIARHAAEGLIELGRDDALRKVAERGEQGSEVARQILSEEG